MKLIPLTNGGHAIVDDEDYERIAAVTWYRFRKYALHSYRVGKKVQHYRMHHVVFGRRCQLDHANGNGLDNRKENLRPATRVENARNKWKLTNKSGYKGVTRNPNTGRWQAQIKADGRRINLGTYISPQLAALAYDAAARQYFGEFAATNEMIGTLKPDML